MESIRQPAVAGTFYPADPVSLGNTIDQYLEAAGAQPNARVPKAIIAPHAGYVYSGETAGSVYRQLLGAKRQIRRVVLLGPSHRVAFRGMAVTSATAFRTPLGDIPIDAAGIQAIVGLPQVGFLDQAHSQEHSLEVHLPFLQRAIGEFELIPIVVGDANKEDVARVLDTLWGGSETLIVISSDLSHYESYDRATELDAKTTQKIVSLDATLVGGEACGSRPINGLLHYLKLNGLSIETVDLKNSGDTAGTRDRVVGYGAWRVLDAAADNQSTVSPADSPEWNLADRQTMLHVARAAIESPLRGAANYNLDLGQFDDRLKQHRATFVTINLDGRLRGCIGSLTAHRPLIVDVAHNAQAAAFKDPRFSALQREEFARTELHISVLSEPWPVTVASRDELITRLIPAKHGLILREGGRQATYLPSVWQQIAEPASFVRELRRKAGLPAEGWQPDTEVMFYTTEEFS
ncbi:MAG: AmmeMemoRadiSam system protein B [Gammaproteobacteria bacterium]